MAGFRSYNAFLKSAKSQQGLSHKQSQSLYRALSTRLGKTPTRLDLKKHPRITKQEARKILTPPRSKRREPKRGPASAPAKPKKRIRSLRDWSNAYESSDDFERETIAAGVDTGRKKKR